VAAKKKPALRWEARHWEAETDGLVFNLCKSVGGWNWWVDDRRRPFRKLGPLRFRDGGRDYPDAEAAMVGAERWLKRWQLRQFAESAARKDG
jgi:hypothetical protein